MNLYHDVPWTPTWECRMFGANEDEGIVWNVVKPPCWFWRWMQYLCFGNKWVRKPEVKTNE